METLFTHPKLTLSYAACCSVMWPSHKSLPEHRDYLSGKENDAFIVSAFFGFTVQQSEAFVRQAFNFTFKIVYFKRNVMDSLAPLLDERFNYGTGGCGTQQFHFRLAGFKKYGLHLFSFNNFPFVTGAVQKLFIRLNSFFQVFLRQCRYGLSACVKLI